MPFSPAPPLPCLSHPLLPSHHPLLPYHAFYTCCWQGELTRINDEVTKKLADQAAESKAALASAAERASADLAAQVRRQRIEDGGAGQR